MGSHTFSYSTKIQTKNPTSSSQKIMKSSLNVAILCSVFIFHSSWTLIEGQRLQRNRCTTSSKCRECEARECDNDQQCRQGFLCADSHKAALKAAGLDPHKAYCAKTTPKNWDLCYDPAKLIKKCYNDTACSDGNVCNGIESCNVTTGVCRPGTPLNCVDKNLCTVDTCDRVTGCFNTPVACGLKKACDRFTGACEDIEKIRPCVAVIEESDSYSDSEIDAKWLSFRTNFPIRPFCLLQPARTSDNRLYKPKTPDFLTDPRNVFAIVNRDRGQPALASDWFGICNYTDVAMSGIDFIGLHMDDGMGRMVVDASLNELIADLDAVSLSYCSVFDDTEDWISPFNTLLGSVGEGDACVVSP